MAVSKDHLRNIFSRHYNGPSQDNGHIDHSRLQQAAKEYLDIASDGFDKHRFESFFRDYRDVFQPYLQKAYNLTTNGFSVNEAGEYQVFDFHRHFQRLGSADRQALGDAIEILVQKEAESGWPNKAMAMHPTLQ